MADLAELSTIPAARAELDARELALVDRARRDGATWAEIAGALGLTSRQAAEQRRLRLATAVGRTQHPHPHFPYAAGLAPVREAALDLYRRIGADRRWSGRFTRAALVRDTLAAVPDASPGALFALVAAALADLAEASVRLPRPTAAAVDRLRAALTAATPQH
jgi:hypothetical protein